MSDGAISQDEIDALLSGVDIGGAGPAFSSPDPMASMGGAPMGSGLNTGVLQTFMQGTIDSLTINLNTMTGANFSVGPASVEVVSRDSLLQKFPDMIVAISSDFSAGLNGAHSYFLAPEFAKKLAGLITKEEITDLDDMSLSVVSEVVSQQTGTEITHLSQTGKLAGLACNPASALHVPKGAADLPGGDMALFTIPVSADGASFSLWEIVGMNVAQGMIDALAPQPAAPAMGGGMSMGGMPPMGDMNMGAMGGMPMGGMPPMGGGMSMGGGMGGMMNMNPPNVQSLQYPSLQNGVPSSEQGNIGLIMDVFMEMTVELGRTKKQIKEILGMGEGTIIELDKLAGEPVDILVNHKPIAKGEVVVIDENFGVRVTEILSSLERVSDIT